MRIHRCLVVVCMCLCVRLSEWNSVLTNAYTPLLSHRVGMCLCVRLSERNSVLTNAYTPLLSRCGYVLVCAIE